VKNPHMRAYLTRPDGLATRLKKARGTMPAKDLAEQASWNKSKVSKIEGGTQLPTLGDLATWGRLTGTSTAVVKQWEQLLSEAESVKDEVDAQARAGVKAAEATYYELLAGSPAARFFELTSIPRFLQIPEYTRATLQQAEPGADAQTDAIVADRQRSASLLYEPGRHFEVLLDEGVLRRLTTDSLVLAAQLDRLQTVIGLPSMRRFGILPFGQRLPATLPTSVALYGNVGYIETALDAVTLLADEVASYEKLFGRLWDGAAEGNDARQIIINARNSLA
jgi:hypothetical protein